MTTMTKTPKTGRAELERKTEEFLATDLYVRKVELMQTLVAGNQAKVRELIQKEKRKAQPDKSKIERLRAEIQRLFKFRNDYERDRIDQTLAALKVYTPSVR